MDTNKNISAYPITAFKTDGELTTNFQEYAGLTKREYIATQIIAGLSANRWTLELGNYSYEQIAEMAVRQTDALFEALSKP